MSEMNKERELNQNEMAFERTEMSSERTEMAKERTAMAEERTMMAVERTSLANSQTLLSYMRTAIAALAAGIGMFEFVENETIVKLGFVVMFIAPVIAAIGIVQFIIVRRRIKKSKQ